MSSSIMMGSYVPGSGGMDMEIGGIPMPVILLIGAVFVLLIIIVSISIARDKKKKNSQSAPLQAAPVQQPQSAPVQPRPVQPVQQPQSAPVQPRPVQPVTVQQIQPAPAQPRPVQPVTVQQIRPADTAGAVRNSDDDDRTQFMPDDDRTQILGEDDDATQMMPQESVLYLTDINNPEKVFQMPVGNGIIIGRRAGEANLVIDYEKSVSGKHCRIQERDGRYYVEDLQSANGTLVDGVRIQTETEITSGCVLTLGRVEVKAEIRCE